MEQRRIIDAKITIQIPVKRVDIYKVNILWEDLIKTPDVLPTDIIHHINWVEELSSGFGSMGTSDDRETYQIPYLTVIRKRPETDEEFFERKSKEESFKRQQEEKDRLDFLRLKAKFEPNTIT